MAQQVIPIGKKILIKQKEAEKEEIRELLS